jgi:predicted DNA-binding transcriptional regulator AlpA
MREGGEAIARIARITGLSRPTIYRVLADPRHETVQAD